MARPLSLHTVLFVSTLGVATTAACDAVVEATDGDDIGGELEELTAGACACAESDDAVDDGESLLSGVSKVRPLPRAYTPTLASVPGAYGTAGRVLRLRPLATGYFISMADRIARDTGVTVWVASAHRSFCYQCDLFERYVTRCCQRSGGCATPAHRDACEAEANTFSAFAGYSEHQLGTAVDMASSESRRRDRFLDGTGNVDTWMEEHATDYGFVVSYPRDTSADGGYIHEPWHVRFLGRRAALEYRRRNTVPNRPLTTFEFIASLTPDEREALDSRDPLDDEHLALARRADRPRP